MVGYYGVLSDSQFIKYLGKNIFVWPFSESNLKGSTYNLTASKIAFYETDDHGNYSVVDEDDVIHIPPQKTVLIQTEESVYIKKNFCGTYHTKVSIVSKGLSSISTTLDPCYFGTSLIALNNQTKEPITINVGDTFCSLMIFKMKSASKEAHDNLPFRADISPYKISYFKYFFPDKELFDKIGQDAEAKKEYFEATKKIRKIYKRWYETGFRRNKEDLIRKVVDYKKIRNKEKNYYVKLIIVFIIVVGISYLPGFLIEPSKISQDTLVGKVITPVAILIFTMINNQIKK